MTNRQISRLGGLLFMLYKPSELASEIGCNPDTIYKSYIPAGCPHQRDKESGSIWIIGTEFAAWARKTIVKQESQAHMERNQAYCMKCRKPVDIEAMKVKVFSPHLEQVRGTCPECGTRVYRARSR